MSLADFDALSPDELNAIMAAHRETEQNAWERVRVLGTILLQPYTSKGIKLTPQKVLHFPWDDDKKDSSKTKPKPMTRDEHVRRAAELLKNG